MQSLPTPARSHPTADLPVSHAPGALPPKQVSQVPATPAKVAQLEAEVALLRAQLDLNRRMAVIGELTSTTTHEFNNLLMTILNYAKLGQRHTDDASRDKAFTRILDAANRATKITGSILSLARNRNGQMEPVDLKGIVEDTLLLLEREFRTYRIHLEIGLDDALPQVQGTASDLQRVLINLLVNARQATPEGGSVRVALQLDAKSRDVILTIRDTGTGIPPETLPRIFDPFFSTKSGPDSSGKGGTGVGLSACKEVIDAHAGRIRVESSVGKGTAFMIRLPSIQP